MSYGFTHEESEPQTNEATCLDPRKHTRQADRFRLRAYYGIPRFLPLQRREEINNNF